MSNDPTNSVKALKEEGGITGMNVLHWEVSTSGSVSCNEHIRPHAPESGFWPRVGVGISV